MDDTKATVLSILADLTGEDVSSNMDVNLFDEGILDSMGSVQLLLELQNQLGIEVPVSEFQRSEWDTPAKIVAKVENLQWTLPNAFLRFLGQLFWQPSYYWPYCFHRSHLD